MVTKSDVHKPHFMKASCIPNIPPPRHPFMKCPVDSNVL